MGLGRTRNTDSVTVKRERNKPKLCYPLGELSSVEKPCLIPSLPHLITLEGQMSFVIDRRSCVEDVCFPDYFPSF